MTLTSRSDDVMVLPLYRRIMFTGTPKNLANYGAATFQNHPC